MLEKFSTTVLLAVGVAGQLIYPGDNCCTFYADHYYGYPLNTYCNAEEAELIMFNLGSGGVADMISSYWCGASVLLNALCSDVPNCPTANYNI